MRSEADEGGAHHGSVVGEGAHIASRVRSRGTQPAFMLNVPVLLPSKTASTQRINVKMF